MAESKQYPVGEETTVIGTPDFDPNQQAGFGNPESVAPVSYSDMGFDGCPTDNPNQS